MAAIQQSADAYFDEHEGSLRQLVDSASSELLATRAVLDFDSRAIEQSQLPYKQMIACGKGCDFCCHQLVMVRAGEARLIAAALLELSDEAREAVTTQGNAQLEALLCAQNSATKDLNVKQMTHEMADAAHRSGLPCPMLDVGNGTCRIYAARPGPCRGAYSFEEKRCQRHFGHDGQPPVQPTEEMGVLGKADFLIASDRKMYPIGVIPRLIDQGRL